MKNKTHYRILIFLFEILFSIFPCHSLHIYIKSYLYEIYILRNNKKLYFLLSFDYTSIM